MSTINFPLTTTSLFVNTLNTNKIIYLPAASTVNAGRLFYIKDICGNAARSSIYISTTGMDRIENRFQPSTLYAVMSTNYGSVLMAPDGALNWYFLQHYHRNAVPSLASPSTSTPSLLTTALSYLPLSTNSTDIGTSPKTITTNGTVTYTTVGGKQAAYFSNSFSNYLSFPYTNQTNFTLVFWLYPIDNGGYTAVSITNSSLNDPALQTDITGLSVTIYTAMPNQWTNRPTGTTSGVGAWTHFAITINQTTYVEELYLNGSLASTVTGSGSTISNRTTFVLGRSGDGGRAYYGYIRDFAFFSRVLSSYEVSTIYTEIVPFSPTSIAGIQLWLDGNDPAGTGTQPANGATVSTWVDKSGNGYNATVAPSRVVGTYSTSFRAVNFATSSTGYITSYSAAPTNETMFVVFNNPSPSSGNNIIIGGVSGARSLGAGYTNAGTGTVGNLNTQIVWLASTGTYTAGTTVLTTSQFTSSTNTISLNGGTAASGGAPGFTAGRVTYLGVDATNSFYHYVGYAMEIIFYNSVLSTNDRQKIEGYLAWKWGIQASLPVGHPYKSAAPTA